MAVTDEEFDALFAAAEARPDSPALRAALIAAADRPVRHAVLRALGIGMDAPAPASAVVDIRSGAPRATTADTPGLDRVGGLEPVKRQLRRRLLDPIRHPGLFDRFRRRAGGGLLLYGPPGCGKTMVVRAIAAEAGVRLIRVEAAEILESPVGASEKKLQAAFAEARAARPCVLFFDEVEALAARRGQASDFRAGLVSAFLGAFDLLARGDDGVLVIGATNVPWSVDTAFRRPGRFDRTLFVPPPDRAARAAILRDLLAATPHDPGIDADALAARTSGCSGADLVHLIETAVDEAIDEALASGGDRPLAPVHLERALAAIRPTTLDWLATARNYAKYASDGAGLADVLDFLDRHAA